LANAQYSGTYTVGDTSADFPRLAVAFDSLNKIGVSGPVTLRLIYPTDSGSAILDSVNGLSSTNILTIETHPDSSFRGSILGSDSTHLSIIKCSHIRFQNLDFKCIDSSNVQFQFVTLSDTVEDIKFINCHFYGEYLYNSGSSWDKDFANAIVSEPGSWIRFGNIINCSFERCRKGIMLQGDIRKIDIDSNRFSNIVKNGIQILNGTNLRIYNNTFKDHSDAEHFALISLKHEGLGTTIERNNFRVRSSSIGHAIRLDSIRGIDSKPFLIANNMILELPDSIGSVAKLFSGIDVNSSENVHIFHNTVQVNRSGDSSWTNASAACRVLATATKNQGKHIIRNNIFMSTAPTHAFSFITDDTVNADSGYISEMDYNIFSSASQLIAIGSKGMNYKNWVQSTNLDSNSKECSPHFEDFDDLHTFDDSIADFCLPISGIDVDFDKESRALSKVDPGADEYKLYPIDLTIEKMEKPKCSGQQPIDLLIRNNSARALHSFYLQRELSIDKGKFKILDTLKIYIKVAPKSEEWIVADSMIYEVRKGYRYRFKTYLPNGKVDLDTKNDTFSTSQTFIPASGTYIIEDSSGVFKSLQEGFSYMASYGVCGPVILLVRDSMNERVDIKKIPNSSPEWTITIQGDTSIARNKIIRNSQFQTNANYTPVRLNDSASFIRLNDMRVEVDGGRVSLMFLMDGRHYDIEINRCYFQGTNHQSIGAFLGTAIAAHNLDVAIYGLKVRDCIFTRGADGIEIRNKDVRRGQSIEVTNCVFEGYKFDGINIRSAYGLTIKNCTFKGRDNIKKYTDIFLDRVAGKVDFSNNYIRSRKTDASYTVRISKLQYYDTCYFRNNIIEGQPDQKSDYHVVEMENWWLMMDHNTIRGYKNPAISIASTNTRITNNIFSGTGNSYIYRYTLDLKNLLKQNYNNYYNANTTANEFYFDKKGGSTNLFNWKIKTYGFFDLNSYTVNPKYKSSSPSVASNSVLNGSAIYPTKTPLDHYGIPRDNTPDIGAEEFGQVNYELGLKYVRADPIAPCGEDSIYLLASVFNYGNRAQLNFQVGVHYSNGKDSGTLYTTVKDTLKSRKGRIVKLPGIFAHGGGYFNFKIELGKMKDTIDENNVVMLDGVRLPTSPSAAIIPYDSACPGKNIRVRVKTDPFSTAWFHSDTSNIPFKVGDNFLIEELTKDTTFFYRYQTVNSENLGYDTANSPTLIKSSDIKSGFGMYLETKAPTTIDSIRLYVDGGPGSVRFLAWDTSGTSLLDSSPYLNTGRISGMTAIDFYSNLQIDSGSFILSIELKNLDGIGWQYTGGQFPIYSGDSSIQFVYATEEFGQAKLGYGCFFNLKINQYICSSKASKFELKARQYPYFELDPDTSFCANEEIDFTLQGPDDPSYSYLWNNSGTKKAFRVTKAGKVSLTIWNNSGCSHTDFMNITLDSLPKFRIIGDSQVCHGSQDSVKLRVESSDSLLRYKWSDGSSDSFTTAIGSGWYSVSVSNELGCSLIDSIEVGEMAELNLELPNDTVVCSNSGFTTTLDAGVWDRYLWSDGSIKRRFMVTEPGQYSVRIFNQHNCEKSDTFELTHFHSPQVNLVELIEYCKGDIIDTFVMANDSFTRIVWSDGDTSFRKEIKRIAKYTAHLYDKNGCVFVDETTVLFKNPTDTLDLGPDRQICDDLEVNENIGVSSKNIEFLWSTGATTAEITAVDSGLYWLSATDTNGCQLLDTININYIPAARPDLGEDIKLNPEFGVDEELKLSRAYKSYVWSTGASTTWIHVTDTGTYSVHVIADNGCEGSDSISIGFWETNSLNGLALQNIAIYPNPSIGLVYVTCPEFLHIVVKDQLGRTLVPKREVRGSQIIDLSRYPAGVYLIDVEIGGIRYVERLIKL